MSGLWRLSVRDEFSAAHALRHYQGKCENTHGHNFSVEICVEGSELDSETGMLLDFKTLKSALKTVLAQLDHSFLNSASAFARINPSSENLARHIWNEMKKQLAQCPDSQAQKVRLKSVTVSEKATQCAVYLGDIQDGDPAGQ